MVIILIRRFVRPDREPEFLATYRAQTPFKKPACKGEKLTRIGDAAAIPPGLRGIALSGPGCVTYLNIAKWDSWVSFAKQFPLADTFDPKIETAPRQRAVLDVIEDP
jgi:hypothetical protein